MTMKSPNPKTWTETTWRISAAGSRDLISIARKADRQALVPKEEGQAVIV